MAVQVRLEQSYKDLLAVLAAEVGAAAAAAAQAASVATNHLTTAVLVVLVFRQALLGRVSLEVAAAAAVRKITLAARLRLAAAMAVVV